MEKLVILISILVLMAGTGIYLAFFYWAKKRQEPVEMPPDPYGLNGEDFRVHLSHAKK